MLRYVWLGMGLLFAGQAWADGCHLVSYGTLPVEMIGDRATAMVKINGKDTRFILDTGATFNLMSRANAAALGLKVSPAPFGLQISGIGGSSSIQQTRIREFRILDATLHNIVFAVGGTDAGDGLLGASLLDIADLEIDLAHGKVTIFKPDHCGKAALAYWTKNGGYEVADTRPWHDQYDRRTYLDVTVNGAKMQAVLDSGASATVITRRAAERAGIDFNGPGVKAGGSGIGTGARSVATWVANVDSFTVGTETIQHSQMQVIDGNMGDDTDVLLGVDFLLAHHLFVANSQRKIYFTYNGGRVFTYADATAAGTPDAAGGGTALQSAADYALRGRAHLSRGESKAAIADLDEAIRMAPGQAGYYLARARAHEADNQSDAALADLDKSLALDQKSLDAWLMRAELRFGTGDHAGAASDAAAAGALAPAGSAQARSTAGLYIALDQPATALPMLDAWIDLHRADAMLGAALNQRCWARALDNQMLEDALKDCRKAIKRDGKVPSYLDSLGLVQLRLHHFPESIEAYEQAAAQMPDSAWTRYGLGLAKILSGQNEAGRADLEAARRLDPQIEAHAGKYGLTAAGP